MKKIQNKIYISKYIFKISILIAICIFAFTIFYFIRGWINGSKIFLNKVHYVKLKADGYHPSSLTIIKGDTVVFSTTTNKLFWPASDPHPIHNIYPEFDPQRAIEPGKTWSFKFNKAGNWKFHDHVEHYQMGSITVRDNRGKVLVSNTNCKSSVKSERKACWERTINLALKTKGVQAAFSVFHHFYITDPLFPDSSCHMHAHRIGDVFYSEYVKNKNLINIDFPKETTACGYGFFHGFLEHYFRTENPKIETAREFCDNLGKRFSKKMPAIRTNCYHAMGHGFMPEPPPKNQWGNPLAIIVLPLRRCENISKTNNQVEIIECTEGVFNVLSVWTNHNEYGLSDNKDDFFKVCRDQAKYLVQYACYYEFSMRIGSYANNDLLIVANLIANIKDDHIAKTIINSAAASVIEKTSHEKDHSKYIIVCHSLPSRLQANCIHGLIGGLTAHGEPGKEHIQGLNFCSSQNFSESEKKSCYKDLFISLGKIYSIEKISQICNMVDTQFKQYCKK